MTVHIQDSPARAYREAGEAHDVDALLATLADDVVFRSPLSATASFAGKEQVRELFSVVFSALSDLRYQSDIGDGRRRALTATARLGRQEIHEAAFVEVGEDGLIKEITMWIRPLPGLTAMMAALGPRPGPGHRQAGPSLAGERRRQAAGGDDPPGRQNARPPPDPPALPLKDEVAAPKREHRS
ncbi:nuclear transport factor 2 family protein [Nonomuraea helvata]|uniref:Nuclear transport factor 2 family protein n=1 Tax=Nonomuraea helvata TaxID=37484 RepID=A0ABV5SH20_9ACTN